MLHSDWGWAQWPYEHIQTLTDLHTHTHKYISYTQFWEYFLHLLYVSVLICSTLEGVLMTATWACWVLWSCSYRCNELPFVASSAQPWSSWTAAASTLSHRAISPTLTHTLKIYMLWEPGCVDGRYKAQLTQPGACSRRLELDNPGDWNPQVVESHVISRQRVPELNWIRGHRTCLAHGDPWIWWVFSPGLRGMRTEDTLSQAW